MADRILAFDLIMGVEEVTTHRIRKFGYGDGYEQIAPDGINTKVREYNITTVPFSALDASLFRGVEIFSKLLRRLDCLLIFLQVVILLDSGL